ncbi:MAG TPA: hypothetical protein VFJ16_22625 [Longimicrobium sp.]|nr:hypothetical protein [Longimicrobium sp.]
MQRSLLLTATLATALALAACDQSTTGSTPDTQLSAAEARQVAGDAGDLDGALLDGVPGGSFDRAPAAPEFASTTVTTTFSRTRTCPAGGSVKLEGTMVHTGDPATHTGSNQFNATRTETACALNRNGATLTINGNPNTVLTASQSWTNGTPGVRTATKKGSFTWTRSTGGSGTCNIDVTHTWTPATHTLHVSGTVCNQTIDITRTWTQGG